MISTVDLWVSSAQHQVKCAVDQPYFTSTMLLPRKVCLLDGDIDFFDIVASVLEEDTLAPYLFIICIDYVLQTSIDLMKENYFTLKKARSRWYPAQTIMDADYADDIVLLTNTPTQFFLSLRVFRLLSSSLSLFPQRFGWYVLRPSSGVCWTREPAWNFELRPLLNPQGSPVLIPLAITGYKS